MTAPSLHLGPAATVLRTPPRASVDMVYADPPFGAAGRPDLVKEVL